MTAPGAPAMADRPYIFFELTNSLCSTCLRKVEAKVIFQEGRVYLVKHCPEHKQEKVLISTDVDYYQFSRRCSQAGHDAEEIQHDDRARLPVRLRAVPRPRAAQLPGAGGDHRPVQPDLPDLLRRELAAAAVHRSLEQVAFMLDCVVRNERRPDIVQISGGEPTIHPEFFEVLDLARERPIKHLMLNTNGVRIANDPEFARRLAGYMPGFEVYLQFDSLDARPQQVMRGADLVEVRRRALEHLNEHGISTTLVVTLEKGLNDDQLGAIIDFALTQPCVRGVTFQPVQVAGRIEGFDPARDRLTLGEVRARILEQSPHFRPSDIVPVPCHPDCLAMAYALKLGGKVVPLTQLLDPTTLLEMQRNTILHEQDPETAPARRRAVLDVALARLLGLDAPSAPLLPAGAVRAAAIDVRQDLPRPDRAVPRPV